VLEPELMGCIATAAENRRGLWISYANAWTLVQAKHSTVIRRVLDSADLCYPDGLGVGLASLLLNLRWLPKVTAEDFILDFCKELANRNLTLALIGATEDVVVGASDVLGKAVPHLEIVLRSSGYFSPAEEELLIAKLLERKPSVVLVGMGQPRQEEWVAKIRPRLPRTVFWCVGGLFDYLVGPRKSADIARRFGLEWAQKLCRSPMSMGRRYLLGIPALFGCILAEHAARLRNVSRRRAIPPHPGSREQ